MREPEHITLMEIHLRELGLTPFAREHMFHERRKWCFDFCVPAAKLGIEIEGGIYTNGGHTRGAGYQANLDKYNAAVCDGWHLLRFSVDDVRFGRDIAYLEAFAPVKGGEE